MWPRTKPGESRYGDATLWVTRRIMDTERLGVGGGGDEDVC